MYSAMNCLHSSKYPEVEKEVMTGVVSGLSSAALALG